MSEEAKTYNIMDLVSQSYIVAVNGSDLQQDGRGINLTTRVVPLPGTEPTDEYYLILCENDDYYYIPRSQLENMKVGKQIVIGEDASLRVKRVKVKDSDGLDCEFSFFKLLPFCPGDLD